MKQFSIDILLFYFSQSFSQGHNRFFEISLGAGVDNISFRDVSSSPLAYSGFGLALALRAKLRRDKGIHQLDIHAISRLLTNNYAQSSTSGSSLDTWEKVSLRYTYLRDVSDDSDYVGSSFHSFILYREYDFFDGQSYEFMARWNVDYQKLIGISDRFALAAQISRPLVAYTHSRLVGICAPRVSWSRESPRTKAPTCHSASRAYPLAHTHLLEHSLCESIRSRPWHLPHRSAGQYCR